MVQTKEERAAKQKVFQKNWRDKNKEHIKLYREKYKAKPIAYYKTPEGKRRSILSGWKRHGTIGDLKGFYDNIYLPATKCQVCKNKFKSNRAKKMDHDHLSGEIRFVLCQSCNTRDYWKKHVAANRIIKLFKILLQTRHV